MNFFRARKNISIDKGEVGTVRITETINKGQLFYVDMAADLPAFGDKPEVLKEHWEELILHNNYGQIRLVPRA
jgi:hypothetical protein